ncbi:taurine dioxygenase [Dongia sp.]|uniref:taurine dioxygenase n=1 Tax=Dongia sp. TaxID=1977262 RepID=UPI0035B34AC6
MSNRIIADRIKVEPLGPAIGARVGGIDLGRPLDAASREKLGDALIAHKVLFFEDQIITPQQQRNFAAAFGKLHIHPIYPQVEDVPEIIVIDTGTENLPDNDNWHTDVTFIETPPLGAVLYAKELPPTGGDTLWVNNEAAFNALSPAFRAFLERLTATHDFAKSFPAERYARTPAEEKKWLAAKAKNKPVKHPVIRTHPVSGAKGLFVNEGFTTRINELSATESRLVLDLLFTHVNRPDFQVRHRWKANDVAMWDNRSTQHYAVADYLPHRRVMHRATILGDRPF